VANQFKTGLNPGLTAVDQRRARRRIGILDDDTTVTSGGGSGAPIDAAYLLVGGADGRLSNARFLGVINPPLQLVDGGPGAALVINITDFAASGGSHARGTVPDPGAVAGSTRFLREDATWAVPGGGSGTVTNIATTLPITGGPITTTGTIGVNTMVASGGAHASGVVPDPGAVAGTSKFLREDATWAAPPVSGTLQSQEFTASGTFNVPPGVTGVWVTLVGAGGGGSTTIAAATGGGGGGSGESIVNMPVVVVASGTVTVTIGAKGTGGAAGQASAQPGANGGDTSFGSQIIARGGLGAAASATSGAGGGAGGSAAKTSGTVGTIGIAESVTGFGGSSGGGGGATTGSNGATGGPAGAYAGAAGGSTAAVQAGGGGGASSVYGAGGVGGAGGAIGVNAATTAYGAGGGGGGGKATTTIGGGNGADGYCLVVWVA
jgi:hypothetical protein